MCLIVLIAYSLLLKVLILSESAKKLKHLKRISKKKRYFGINLIICKFLIYKNAVGKKN